MGLLSLPAILAATLLWPGQVACSTAAFSSNPSISLHSYQGKQNASHEERSGKVCRRSSLLGSQGNRDLVCMPGALHLAVCIYVDPASATRSFSSRPCTSVAA